MTEQELQVFINSTVNYFNEVSASTAAMGTPYIKEAGEQVLLDYTGLIGISGVQKGCVYYTTSNAMLSDLAVDILGEPGDATTLNDLIGEIANTVAGNAQKTFGSDFMISVPVVIKGDAKGTELNIKPPTYVVPVTWKGHKGFIVVGIEKND